MPLVECVVVVDADINVFHEPEVLWAVYTYADMAHGLSVIGTGQHVVSNQGTRLSFATTQWSGRVVVDATRPRSEAPPEVMLIHGGMSGVPPKLRLPLRRDATREGEIVLPILPPSFRAGRSRLAR
jgi:3-polyprenyl-4-hydroxybenzoate decarboxylase